MSPTLAKELRGPIEQMLSVVLAGFEGSGRPRRELPFAVAVPGFFEYLVAERGLAPASVHSYRPVPDRPQGGPMRVAKTQVARRSRKDAKPDSPSNP